MTPVVLTLRECADDALSRRADFSVGGVFLELTLLLLLKHSVSPISAVFGRFSPKCHFWAKNAFISYFLAR